MKQIIFAFTFILLLLPITAFSQTPTSKESLRGLHGVFVNILPLAADAQADGLSAAQVQKIVETELHKAGIPINSESKFGQEFAGLIITIDTIKHPQGVYVFTVSVAVVQEVKISRTQGKGGIFPAETYSKRALGITTPSRMNLLYEPLKEKIGEFVSNYVSINPSSKNLSKTAH